MRATVMYSAGDVLFAVPRGPDEALMPAPLALSDVMGTGHHAALTAPVRRGGKAAVIGDGAVGLCGVIAAKRIGAEQIIALACGTTKAFRRRRSRSTTT